MKITDQSIEWLGDGKARVITTRTKGGRGFGFARIGPFGIGGKSRGKRGEVTEVIGMEYERYKHERDRIKQGRFRAFDPDQFHTYDEAPEVKRQRRAKERIERIRSFFQDRKKRKRERKQELQAQMNMVTITSSPPKTGWWWAIVVAVAYWSLMMALTGALVEGSILYWALSIGWGLSWALLPVAIYKDADVATAYAPNWFPSRRLYIIGAVIPYLDIFVGMIYLIQRWRYGRENTVQTELAESQQ